MAASSSMISIFDMLFYLTAKFAKFFAKFAKIQNCFINSPDWSKYPFSFFI
jgi:hypothetical protein